jgi:two-component system response regulator GlrR
MISPMNEGRASRGRILLVDDDPGLLRLLAIRLRAESYDVEAVQSAEEALGALPVFRPDLVITDLRMEKMDGIGLLKEIQRLHPGLCVLLLTAHGTIPDAVEATQSGAFGFLTKPVDKGQLLDHVERAMKVTAVPRIEEEWSSEIITRSPAMEACLQQARMVARTETRILITGESGTGKELMARAIHRASHRRDGPFVAINCSAMAENLLESELFGHQKGAFTGAHKTHKGLFQAAEGGTLLLDEIGDMPARLQVKLLRVLQEQQVRPVGSTEAVAVNARVISATNQNLNDMMVAGTFREDLYYRLNVVNIRLPALRERREDVPLLVEYFLKQVAEETEGDRKVYSPEAVELLVANHWPGNIRQLYNTVRQNVALSPARVIAPDQVRSALGEQANSLPSFSQAREEFTRIYLSQLLQITGGNVSQAARLAKRNRTDFYKLLGRHQLNPEHFK